MKKLKNTAAALTAAVTSAVISVAANAEGGLAASKAVTGTKALLNDISNILLVVAPLVGTACMKNIRNKLTFKALILREAAREKALAFRAKALDTTGEGYVDTAVKIIIAVVIGALLMAGLVALFNEVIMPRVNTEVTELFDAAG